MHDHRNATLGPAGRRRIVEAVEGGVSQKRAAARFCVSPATVNRWVVRARQASPAERRSGACFETRSSRPHRSPRMLSEAGHDRVCEARLRTGWGPRLIASEVELPHASVHRALRRRGVSRKPRVPKEAVVRYEWPCPGNLLHQDTKRFGRFDAPGHALTRDRAHRSRGAGWEFVHSLEDDCSRVAYCEVHDDERAATVAAFTRRALDWFLGLGIVAERILTDNHFSYTNSRAYRELLASRAIEHWTIRPYRPQTNGKVERFNLTLKNEWAYAIAYSSNQERLDALRLWLHHYNHHRPHLAHEGEAPMAIVNNVCGKHT